MYQETDCHTVTFLNHIILTSFAFTSLNANILRVSVVTVLASAFRFTRYNDSDSVFWASCFIYIVGTILSRASWWAALIFFIRTIAFEWSCIWFIKKITFGAYWANIWGVQHVGGHESVSVAIAVFFKSLYYQYSVKVGNQRCNKFSKNI